MLMGAATVIIGITILIFIHELGHFIMAKRNKVRVEAFSIGFGPKLIGFKRGETEYRLCVIPFGGYVKMAGESLVDENRTGAPDEFVAKPPFTRIRIFVAGVVMNFLFAFPLCILIYLFGINFFAPVVGAVQFNSAEAKAGLRPGDVIQEVDGRKIATLDDYIHEIIGAPNGRPLVVTLSRNNQIITATVVAQGTSGLGIVRSTQVVSEVLPGSPAEKSGLKPRDVILAVDGSEVWTYEDIIRRFENNTKLIVPLTVRRPTGKVETISVELPTAYSVGTGELMPPQINKVERGTPADRAGILKDDLILSINETPILSWRGLSQTIRNSTGELNILVRRNNQEIKISRVIPNITPIGRKVIGVSPVLSTTLGEVITGSAIALAGLQANDTILQVNGVSVTNLSEVDNIASFSNGKPLELLFQRGSVIMASQVTPVARPRNDNIGFGLTHNTVLQKYQIGKAVTMGINETIGLVKLTFQLIWKLVIGEESAKGLGGPIGIFYSSYLSQKEGLSKFLWLLALFSINLAILNLVPIPILDGGGVLFCLIEKIKGSPVNIKIQVIAQYVGLFLILSLAVFATYNDIINFIIGRQ